MFQNNSYLFVDGSSLLGDIARLWLSDEALKNRRLDLLKFCGHFTSHSKYGKFLGGGYRRFTSYFVAGESRIERMLVVPDFTRPNVIEDINIRHCGKLLSGGGRLQQWVDENSPPQFVLDRLNKAEKAVDTQICCDALQLAASNQLGRLFLYTNDYDYMPLLDVLKAMGCNVTLFQLTEDRVNRELVGNFDAFCVPSKSELGGLFEPAT